MAFEQEPTRGPVSIGNLVVILKDAWERRDCRIRVRIFRYGW
jgi:hypothetical protein